VADGAFTAIIIVYGYGDLEALLTLQLKGVLFLGGLEKSQEKSILYKAFGNIELRRSSFSSVVLSFVLCGDVVERSIRNLNYQTCLYVL
jgi:hypothetical protein